MNDTTPFCLRTASQGGEQVTPVVLEAIGAAEVELFLIRENDCVPIHLRYLVALSPELPSFLVLQCEREGAVHFSIDKPVYIKTDATDGA